MSVTARRLGVSPLTIDWSGLGRSAELESTYSQSARVEAWEKLTSRFSSGEVGFYSAPSQDDLSQLTACLKMAEKIRAEFPQLEDVLFLGIGGSYLGPLAILESLTEKRKNAIRFHFLDNPDALVWKTTLDSLSPAKTLVCSVTKSGTTFETIAQTILALEWLGKDRWKKQFVALTDPEKGDLRAFCKEHDLLTLSIHTSIGGRFSAFSPVGLFPMALGGVDCAKFLEGAREVTDSIGKLAPEKNPVFILGATLLEQSETHPIHVCMPYLSRLKKVSDWFVQLWAESLGKDGKGFTPLSALGASDQHSLVQLLRDGPNDKVTFFISIDKVEPEVKVPFLTRTLKGRYSAFSILEGHGLHELLNIEYRATSLVLTKQNRPHLSFRLDELNERSLGALLMFFATLTGFTGTLWNVDPFNQPGVEEAKLYIRESLSQPKEYSAEEDENSPVNRLRRNRD